MATLVKGPEGDELPAGPPESRDGGGTSRTWRARRRQFGLRHLMGLSVVLGIIFAAIAQAMRTGEAIDMILAAITVGLGISALGAFLALRLERWGIVGWMLVCIGPTALAVAIVGASSEFNPQIMVMVALYVLPVLVGLILHVVIRLRAAQQESLLWVLALAADRDRPLGPAVTALADQSSGTEKARLLRVAECLEHGLPLPDALEFVSRSVPAPALLLVRVGHDSGTLPEALHDAASARSGRPAGWLNFGARVAYLCLILLCIQTIIGYVLYFVVPRLEAIFRDFGTVLPDATRSVIRWGNWLGQSYILPSVAVVEGLVLLYIPFAFGGFAELAVPFIDGLFLRRHAVLILRCLAMVVEGDRPIGAGLHTLAQRYPTDWVRERLAGVAIATDQGLDWIDALRRYALISRTDVALLESARRAGNLPWALRELAEGSARRLGYRLQAIGQVMMTLALLALGGFVAFIAIAFFYPLVTLIERLVG
jgi:type II secretory pathway component PulF